MRRESSGTVDDASATRAGLTRGSASEVGVPDAFTVGKRFAGFAGDTAVPGIDGSVAGTGSVTVGSGLVAPAVPLAVRTTSEADPV